MYLHVFIATIFNLFSMLTTVHMRGLVSNGETAKV